MKVEDLLRRDKSLRKVLKTYVRKFDQGEEKKIPCIRCLPLRFICVHVEGKVFVKGKRGIFEISDYLLK